MTHIWVTTPETGLPPEVQALAGALQDDVMSIEALDSEDVCRLCGAHTAMTQEHPREEGRKRWTGRQRHHRSRPVPRDWLDRVGLFEAGTHGLDEEALVEPLEQRTRADRMEVGVAGPNPRQFGQQ
jgi:hypothetical protein